VSNRNYKLLYEELRKSVKILLTELGLSASDIKGIAEGTQGQCSCKAPGPTSCIALINAGALGPERQLFYLTSCYRFRSEFSSNECRYR